MWHDNNYIHKLPLLSDLIHSEIFHILGHLLDLQVSNIAEIKVLPVNENIYNRIFIQISPKTYFTTSFALRRKYSIAQCNDTDIYKSNRHNTI